MISTVLNYLKSDNELVNMLGHRKEFPKITAFEPHDKNAYPYLCITLTPFNMGIVTDQYRCEVRIVTDHKELYEDLTQKVNKLLHFRNRPGFISNGVTLYHSSFNGSGYFYDEDKKVFEQTLIYNMTFKI